MSDGLNTAFRRHPKIDDLFWEELEEILIGADVGFEATLEIVDSLKEAVKREKLSDSEAINGYLSDEIARILAVGQPAILRDNKQIIIVLGVNGAGKTTTIAKLTNLAKNKGKSTLLAAADTFRAAAIEQLEQWANKSDVKIVKQERGSDPAAVVYDSIASAASRDTDCVIVDTAGRLHTQANLMEELKKIKRVAESKAGEYTVKTLLVLDANIGQNALAQTSLFNEALGVDEIALTKMDGTAKGGIIIAIAKNFSIPVSFIGFGEQIDDLQEFDSKEFANALIEP